MFTRFLLVTILASLIATQAFAQSSAKDKLIQSQKKAPINNTVQDPTSLGTPIPSLPSLSGKTWNEWIVPGSEIGSNSPAQNTKDTLSVINLGDSEVGATVECYNGIGKRVLSKTLSVGKHARGFASVKLKPFTSFGWCRVSADNPIMVYYSRFVFEKGQHSDENTGIKYRTYHSETVLAIPFPSE